MRAALPWPIVIDHLGPMAKGGKPDDAVLPDLLSARVPGETARHKLLVTNPASLFGFPETM